LHESLKRRLPGFTVWLNTPFIPEINIGMSHFMNVRNQKSVWIEVGIYRNLKLVIRQYSKIAEPGLPRFNNPKAKFILLPECLTVGSSGWRKVKGEWIYQGIKNKKAL